MNETIENIANLCGWKVSIDNGNFEFEQMIGTNDFVFSIQSLIFLRIIHKGTVFQL